MTDLINTLDLDSEFDAMSKLRPGEPYFLLLGRDRLAPDLVRKWAQENRERALKEFDDDVIGLERRDRELRKSTEAEMRAESMREFKRGDLERKAAQEPTVKTYSGHELPEETKRRDAIQAATGRTLAALNNAIAEFSTLAEVSGEVEFLPDEIEHLRSLVGLLTPKRPGIAA
jgi:hypothetical protein